MKDPWRYRCPEGHSSWQSRQNRQIEAQGEYYCEACRKAGDNPYFNTLRDAKKI